MPPLRPQEDGDPVTDEMKFGDPEQDPQTLDEAMDRVPMLSDLTGIPRSQMRRLVTTTWPEYHRVKSLIQRGCVGGPHALGTERDCAYCGDERIQMLADKAGGDIRDLARMVVEARNEREDLMALSKITTEAEYAALNEVAGYLKGALEQLDPGSVAARMLRNNLAQVRYRLLEYEDERDQT